MKVRILKTSPKHYAEKKQRLAPASTVAPKRRKLIAQTKPTFLQASAIKNALYPSLNKFKKTSDMPKEQLEFVNLFIAQDWYLVLNHPHDFMVAKKIFINSIVNN